MVDQIGMIQQASGLVSLSYGFSFAEKHHIRIGTSLGYNQYRVDPSTAIAFDPDDPVINGGVQAGGTINLELGLMYAWKGLELSLGSKHEQSTSNMPVQVKTALMVMDSEINSLISYNINFGDKWRFSVFTKGINNGYQFDMNADGKDLDGGLGYRTGRISRSIGNSNSRPSLLGYAYEAPTLPKFRFTEVILGIKKAKRKKFNCRSQEEPDTFKMQLEKNL